mmetsp:Transcript_35160/g.89854  ORF Transcript_35160/g.89854 Transcript_35160/m.89854 type:complete len:320 (-) Transcript_35160:3008-3967(-)
MQDVNAQILERQAALGHAKPRRELRLELEVGGVPALEALERVECGPALIPQGLFGAPLLLPLLFLPRDPLRLDPAGLLKVLSLLLEAGLSFCMLCCHASCLLFLLGLCLLLRDPLCLGRSEFLCSLDLRGDALLFRSLPLLLGSLLCLNASLLCLLPLHFLVHTQKASNRVSPLDNVLRKRFELHRTQRPVALLAPVALGRRSIAHTGRCRRHLKRVLLRRSSHLRKLGKGPERHYRRRDSLRNHHRSGAREPWRARRCDEARVEAAGCVAGGDLRRMLRARDAGGAGLGVGGLPLPLFLFEFLAGRHPRLAARSRLTA